MTAPTREQGADGICCFCGQDLATASAVEVAVHPTSDRSEVQGLWAHDPCLSAVMHPSVPSLVGRSEEVGRFRLKVSSDDPGVAYLSLPGHAVGPTKTSRSVRLVDVLGRYEGPDVVLDFDAAGVLVGIEVVG